MPFIILIVLFSFFGVRMVREWHKPGTNWIGKLGICIAAAGILGFTEAFWINLIPETTLAHVELPNPPTGDRLVAHDGRVFIVNVPLARVQRYGSDGFEEGFSYGFGSKTSKFGITASGNILICTLGGTLLTYSPDGVEIPPRASCKDSFPVSPSYQVRAKAPEIASNWFSALAVPLWHPVIGWLFIGLGGAISYISSMNRADLDPQRLS